MTVDEDRGHFLFARSVHRDATMFRLSCVYLVNSKSTARAPVAENHREIRTVDDAVVVHVTLALLTAASPL